MTYVPKSVPSGTSSTNKAVRQHKHPTTVIGVASRRAQRRPNRTDGHHTSRRSRHRHHDPSCRRANRSARRIAVSPTRIPDHRSINVVRPSVPRRRRQFSSGAAARRHHGSTVSRTTNHPPMVDSSIHCQRKAVQLQTTVQRLWDNRKHPLGTNRTHAPNTQVHNSVQIVEVITGADPAMQRI